MQHKHTIHPAPTLTSLSRSNTTHVRPGHILHYLTDSPSPMSFLFPAFDQSSSSSFSTSYKCYPVSFFPGNLRDGVEKGGKIIMPPSALSVLSRLNVQYPMLFKLTNEQANRTTHCGVLEFVADEGNIYVPYWMLRNLLLEEGGWVSVVNASLPIASFAKFQPQSVDFLDISNPKAVLENLLRNFACLTVGDVIAINYNDRVYELKVLETRPKDAVTIIECDMTVDFAPPFGYEEENMRDRKHKKKEVPRDDDDHVVIPEGVVGFQAFSGTGHRLDGKQKPPEPSRSSSEISSGRRERGIPNYSYQPGSLTFFRNTKVCATQVTFEGGMVVKRMQSLYQARRKDQELEQPTAFKPFEGVGHQLKTKTKPKA